MVTKNTQQQPKLINTNNFLQKNQKPSTRNQAATKGMNRVVFGHYWPVIIFCIYFWKS